MTKQKQMTEKELTQSVELSDKELDEISGGPNRNPYAQYVASYQVFGDKEYTNGMWSIRAGKICGQFYYLQQPHPAVERKLFRDCMKR
jgi:bacteriocin-like protein